MAEIQLMISLLHAYVAIVAALTDSRQSQTLLLFMVCHKSALLAQARPTMMKHLPSTCEVQTTGLVVDLSCGPPIRKLYILATL